MLFGWTVVVSDSIKVVGSDGFKVVGWDRIEVLGTQLRLLGWTLGLSGC